MRNFLTGMLVTLLAFMSIAWYTNRDWVLVRKGMSVNNGSSNLANAMLTIKSDGTKDMVNGLNSSGTEVYTVDKDGVVTVAGMTGADYVDLDGQTADPCPGWAPNHEGRIFFNSTGSFPCFCDSSTDDLKMTDNTTACF